MLQIAEVLNSERLFVRNNGCNFIRLRWCFNPPSWIAMIWMYANNETFHAYTKVRSMDARIEDILTGLVLAIGKKLYLESSWIGKVGLFHPNSFDWQRSEFRWEHLLTTLLCPPTSTNRAKKPTTHQTTEQWTKQPTDPPIYQPTWWAWESPASSLMENWHWEL